MLHIRGSKALLGGPGQIQSPMIELWANGMWDLCEMYSCSQRKLCKIKNTFVWRHCCLSRGTKRLSSGCRSLRSATESPQWWRSPRLVSGSSQLRMNLNFILKNLLYLLVLNGGIPLPSNYDWSDYYSFYNDFFGLLCKLCKHFQRLGMWMLTCWHNVDISATRVHRLYCGAHLHCSDRHDGAHRHAAHRRGLPLRHSCL